MSVSRRLLPAALALASLTPVSAAPNWANVPAKTVTLFYPGRTSFEWLTTPAKHIGAVKVRDGRACAACHTGQERSLGDAAGKKNEPEPIAGKPAVITTKVQFARDAQNLYIHLEFSDAGQPDANMGKAAASVAMMLGGEGTGCWAACHDDSLGMASGGSRTMYLGHGTAPEPPAALEYWRVELGAKPAVSNGTVLDRRAEKKSIVTAEATRNGTMWLVTMTRKLAAGTVAIAPGRRYTVAFAIDAGHTAKRFHYVSFERSLVLDSGVADFVAK